MNSPIRIIYRSSDVDGFKKMDRLEFDDIMKNYSVDLPYTEWKKKTSRDLDRFKTNMIAITQQLPLI